MTPFSSKKKTLFFILIMVFPLLIISSISVSAKTSIKNSLELDLFAERYAFTPNKIIVTYGTNVTLILHSKDIIHGFFLEGYDLTQTICNEHNFTLSFIANKIGTYIFKCYEPACGPYHPYMVGSLTVIPDNQLSFQFFTVFGAFLFITSIFLLKWRKSISD